MLYIGSIRTPCNLKRNRVLAASGSCEARNGSADDSKEVPSRNFEIVEAGFRTNSLKVPTAARACRRLRVD